MLSVDQIQAKIDEAVPYIPVSKIEEKLGMPPTTLQKFLSGKRDLPKKWTTPVQEYFTPLPHTYEVFQKGTDGQIESKPLADSEVGKSVKVTVNKPTLEEIKKNCPTNLKGLDRTMWINAEKEKQNL